MKKCLSCGSTEQVVVGGAVLIEPEQFCDILQCSICLNLSAIIPRQLTIRVIDRENEAESEIAVLGTGHWSTYEWFHKPAKEQQNV